MSNHYFRNTRVLITGATGGIGQALALELAQRGAQVIAAGRNHAKLQQLAECSQHDQHPIQTCVFDVTDFKQTLAAAQKIHQLLGGIDMVILNAAVMYQGSFDTLTVDQCQEMVNTNYLSLLYGVKAFVPLLEHSAIPHLVGMSSILSYLYTPENFVYSSTKAAGSHFLFGLAHELKNKNISLSVISPGRINTGMSKKSTLANVPAMDLNKAIKSILIGLEKRKSEIILPYSQCLAVKLYAKLPCTIRRKLDIVSYSLLSTLKRTQV